MKKIMLCCNAGMSTSLLVQKMQAEVANRGLDIEVEARPMNEAHDHLGECDMLLLGRPFPGRGHQHGRLRPHERCRHHRPLRQRDGLGAPHGGYERTADDLL